MVVFYLCSCEYGFQVSTWCFVHNVWPAVRYCIVLYFFWTEQMKMRWEIYIVTHLTAILSLLLLMWLIPPPKKLMFSSLLVGWFVCLLAIVIYNICFIPYSLRWFLRFSSIIHLLLMLALAISVNDKYCHCRWYLHVHVLTPIYR